MVFKPGKLGRIKMTFVEKRDLLFRLGYFLNDEIKDFEQEARDLIVENVTDTSTEFANAVKKFQEFYHHEYAGLYDNGQAPIDGMFGEKTMQAAENMLANRYCNHPDISPQIQGKGLRRWAIKDITYGHELQKLPGVSAELIHKAYVRAAESWNAICGLEAKYTEQTSQANIQAYAKRIDGRGGTLAWSYLPGYGSGRDTKLEQRFDSGDRYSNYVFAEEVDKHEYGHALGFDHDNGRDSNGQYSIMHASAIGIRKQNLNDTKGAVKRYGKSTTPIPTPPAPTPTDPPVQPTPYGSWAEFHGADGSSTILVEPENGGWSF